MAQSLAAEFGILRSFFWPIHRHETRKIVPMLLMCFLVCFNYSILRNMKDSVVVTTSGAEVIPFIKVWVLLPMAVLLTYIFTRLSNRYSQEQVVYFMISGFLSFYALFVFVLYPMQATIHPHVLAEHLENVMADGFYGLIEMFRYWSLTLFYVMAELWSSIVIHVLFWGFANEITKIGEARRFYSVLGIGANLAAIFAGQAGNFFSTGGIYNPNLPFGSTAWEQTTMMLTTVVIISGLAAMGICRWMNRNVLNDPSFDELHNTRREIKKKKKLSVRESFSFLSNSKYLLCIATLVVVYNLVINLVEVVWKDQLKILYPTPSDYNHYMNNLTSAIGVVSTITAFFMARIIFRFGWTRTAMITPVIMLITCLGFFSFYIFQDSLSGLVTTVLGTSPLVLVVFFGGAQNCLSKAAKYSVFDTTKEMAFIPLEHGVKLRGKAAIDGVGSRFGKSGGAVIHQSLLMIFGGFSKSAPYIASFLLAAIACWIVAVKYLGIQFNALVKSQDKNVASTLEGFQASSEPEEKPVTA
jgi:AAA family ATP:ADP antiporter